MSLLRISLPPLERSEAVHPEFDEGLKETAKKSDQNAQIV
jgi:hypothetical protein